MPIFEISLDPIILNNHNIQIFLIKYFSIFSFIINIIKIFWKIIKIIRIKNIYWGYI